MKFTVFYFQFINSLDGLGMCFSSAVLVRRLRTYAATLVFKFLVFVLFKDKFRIIFFLNSHNPVEMVKQ